jgi:fimbrial isopeptide formation D2 family protein/LPXTG-motif cell wall-anchored protein
MKKFRKIASLVLAASMMAAMPVSMATTMVAYADTTDATTTTYSITIKQNAKDTGEHTYGAYQIFAGTLSEDGNTLSDITWGSGVTGVDNFTFAEKSSAADIAAALNDNNAADFATAIETKLGTATGTATGKGDVTIDGLPAGYYLIKDTTAPTTEGKEVASETVFVLKLIKSQEVQPKSSVPEHVKNVDDVNDSTGAKSELKDSADYDIGDSVPYTLTTTLGEGMDNYKSYSVAINDKMYKGLTYNNDAKIYIGETEVTSSFTKADPVTDDDYNTYKWSCADIKAISGVTVADGTKITIKYSATLNDQARVGSDGNPNESWLQYDNNPNESGKGTPGGETPHDKNIVFTYKAIFNKVDDQGKALTGADFTLYKKVFNGWTDVTKLNNGENAKNPSKDVTSSTDSEGKVTEKSVFTFSGLDDGEYKLVESTTPNGFNTMDDVYFTISASHDLESDDPKLTELNGTQVNEDGQAWTGEFTFTAKSDKDAGSLTSDITNVPGSTLPTTGGMGTTILYVAGAILVIAGAAVLVIKKRHEA